MIYEGKYSFPWNWRTHIWIRTVWNKPRKIFPRKFKCIFRQRLGPCQWTMGWGWGCSDVCAGSVVKINSAGLYLNIFWLLNVPIKYLNTHKINLPRRDGSTCMICLYPLLFHSDSCSQKSFSGKCTLEKSKVTHFSLYFLASRVRNLK